MAQRCRTIKLVKIYDTIIIHPFNALKKINATILLWNDSSAFCTKRKIALGEISKWIKANTFVDSCLFMHRCSS